MIVLLITSINIIQSHKRELITERFNNTKNFVQFSLDYLEKLRAEKEYWRDSYTIEFLKAITQKYDNEKGIVSRVLDKDLNVITTPYDGYSVINNDIFSKKSQYFRDISRNLEFTQGTFNIHTFTKDYYLYYRAYPIRDKVIIIVVGVTDDVTSSNNLEYFIIISITLMILIALSVIVILLSKGFDKEIKFKRDLDNLFTNMRRDTNGINIATNNSQ